MLTFIHFLNMFACYFVYILNGFSLVTLKIIINVQTATKTSVIHKCYICSNSEKTNIFVYEMLLEVGTISYIVKCLSHLSMYVYVCLLPMISLTCELHKQLCLHIYIFSSRVPRPHQMICRLIRRSYSFIMRNWCLLPSCSCL